jgi:hypothetical protein
MVNIALVETVQITLQTCHQLAVWTVIFFLMKDWLQTQSYPVVGLDFFVHKYRIFKDF